MTADAVRALIPVEAFQSISIKPNSRVAFVTFVDPAAASAFLQKTSSDGLTVDKQNVVVNRALERSPTRCVYVGDIQDFDALDRQRLRADFGEFGAISRVRVNKPNRCVFITFDSIPNATKALDTMRTRPDYANFRLEYAEDRLEDAQQRKVFIGGSKTVFLPLKEKLQADFSQFGEIEGIDVLTVKNVAFVTLTKAPDATKAIDEIKKRPEYAGLTVSLSADKWSPSTPASAIYVGEIADFTTFTADRLRADFSPFAEVTAVKVVKKKECAFVRFGSVSDATKAMNAIKTRPEYAEMIVHFANPA
ncbi:hypothetical protein C8F01DRAFT_267354 [Mycena amicta]|nr:hypothetical protein C8F01DRAFT_267354 [Mycena amicta]